MKFDQDERLIKEQLSKVCTPEYDLSLALADRIRPPRRFAGKSFIILAAVLLGLFGLIGAGTYYEWKSFRFDGSVNDGASSSLESTADGEDSEFSSVVSQEMSLTPSALAPGEVSIVTHLQDGQSSSNAACGVFRTDSEQTLLDLLLPCAIPYSIPTRLPDGYQFEEAVIQFYVDPGMLDIPSESLSIEGEHDKTIRQTLKLPDGYQKNIQDIYVGYVNSSGEFIRMTISLAAADWNVSFGAPDTAYSEKLKLDGYNQALLICDESRKNGSYYSLGMTRDIPVVTAVNLMDLGRSERNAAAGIKDSREPFEETYNQLSYYIESSAIEKGELMDFVKGFKTP
ncbi:hypothetical protein [Diplocloster hominis]|uniref:hypothetical protein n=1 Tax=Diplocloster hominis TaxID=3079010 RepID=UPI0031BB7159